MKDKATASFHKQGFMKSIGAKLISVEKGAVKIECEHSIGLTQQHGYFHAGVVTSIVDVACGYAAYTLMPENSNVLTVEYKVNFIRPANGNKIIASGKVLKAGKTLTVCEGVVMDEKEEIIFAKMIATMICVKAED